MRKIVQTCWGVVLVVGLVCAIVLFPKVPFSALSKLPPVQKTVAFVCLTYWDAVGGPGAPEHGERMIREAARDLFERQQKNIWPYNSEVELRRCVDDLLNRHKRAERYQAQKCYIEWRTLQEALMGNRPFMDPHPLFPKRFEDPEIPSYFRDVLLFDDEGERVWATVYAPQQIIKLVKQFFQFQIP